MPRLELPMTVAVRKQETKEAYTNMKAFNMLLSGLKCQLDFFKSQIILSEITLMVVHTQLRETVDTIWF